MNRELRLFKFKKKPQRYRGMHIRAQADKLSSYTYSASYRAQIRTSLIRTIGNFVNELRLLSIRQLLDADYACARVLASYKSHQGNAEIVAIHRESIRRELRRREAERGMIDQRHGRVVRGRPSKKKIRWKSPELGRSITKRTTKGCNSIW